MAKMVGDKIRKYSGGSGAFIILDDDYVCKILIVKQPQAWDNKSDNNQKEHIHYKFLTKLIKKHTPHFVGMFDYYEIVDVGFFFKKPCEPLDKLLVIKHKTGMKYDPSALTQYCALKSLYDRKLLKVPATMIVMERCQFEFENIYIGITNTLDKKKIETFLFRTMFQIIYTLAVTQKIYPGFVHNDLFFRNVLVDMENDYDDDDCVEYIFDSVSYFLPANGTYVKINDFGFSINPTKVTTTLQKDIELNNSPSYISFEIDNPKRDVYTFLKEIMFFYPRITKFSDTKKYNTIRDNILQNFFDKKYYDKTVKDKSLAREVWSIGSSKILMKTVKEPHQYFNTSVFDRYKTCYGEIVRTYQD
jgi:hypothetical protein